jgi:hypothetical protein
MTKDKSRKKHLLKLFIIAVAVQIVGVLFLGLLVIVFPPMTPVLVSAFYFYTPTVFLIWIIGEFKGEAALIWPMVLGIPVGILVYSFVFARVYDYVSGRRSHGGSD